MCRYIHLPCSMYTCAHTEKEVTLPHNFEWLAAIEIMIELSLYFVEEYVSHVPIAYVTFIVSKL